jgi:transposase
MVKTKKTFEIINAYSAGIDISSAEHFVCVPDYCSEDPVRKFGAFTEDLHKIIAWLKECKITTVAMESTGIYWLQLYLLLEESGIDACLVNAQHVKNVTGRKSDVQDCQWIQQLHSFGLLANSYQPKNEIRVLRNLMRSRGSLVEKRSSAVIEQQSALDYMNIKLHNVLSDLDGLSGQTIVKTIIAGERNPVVLSQLAHPRVKTDRKIIQKSLEGTWRDEQIFLLKQAYESYCFFNDQIAALDKEFKKQVLLINKQIVQHDEKPSKPRSKKSGLNFKADQYLPMIYGVDITRVEGINEHSAMQLYSELGVDIKNKFPTIKRFISWLNLAPNVKISGGRVLSSKMRKRKNRAGQIFRRCAYGILNSKGHLGNYVRYKKAKKGAGTAIVATAQKIARMFYKMVTDKVEYNHNLLADRIEQNWIKKIEKTEKYLEKLKLQMPDIICITN